MSCKEINYFVSCKNARRDVMFNFYRRARSDKSLNPSFKFVKIDGTICTVPSESKNTWQPVFASLHDNEKTTETIAPHKFSGKCEAYSCFWA